MHLKITHTDGSIWVSRDVAEYEEIEILSVGDIVEFVEDTSSVKLVSGVHKTEVFIPKGTLAIVHLTFDQYAFYQYQVRLSEIARYNVKSEWIRKIGEKTK